MGFDYFLYNFVCQCFENIFEKRFSVVEIIEMLFKFSKGMEGKLFGSFLGDKVGIMLQVEYDYKFKVVVLGEFGVGKMFIVVCFKDVNKQFFEILFFSIN